MRTIRALPSLFIVFLFHCSDPTPDPGCTVGCDGGAQESGGPDGGADDSGADSALPDSPALDGALADGGAADGPPDAAVDTNTGTEGRSFEATSYELVGRFDWASRLLRAKERITLRRTASGTMLVLDAAVTVKSLQVEGFDSSFTSSATALRIDVSAVPSHSETLTVVIEYDAAVSDALVASVSRDDDPVKSRVAYTDSEPFGGSKWLPAIHQPSDRAQWKVELTVAESEDVVANGTRTKDEIVNGERVVRYEMNDPIPTYTMAFAAGELEHRDRTTGRVPLSVWFRRGLSVDADQVLDFLAGAMSTFESRLGPYPWTRYAVVLLPEFSGGMENTTVTFTSEASGQANLGTNLHAHELGHQWYGDWVTPTTFDDLWIKEGMATLLAVEAERALRDGESKGRLFGYDFAFAPTDAIRDKSLSGLAKYTSGPYSRAAWLLTQIRDRVGEATFWAALREVLARHALGNVDSESFVRSFGMSEEMVQKVLRSLDQKEVPSVSIGSHPHAEGTLLNLTLSDPAGTMIAPTVVTVVSAAGEATTSRLEPGVPLALTVPTGGYVALDETDVHPDWSSSFVTNTDEYAGLVPLFFPSSEAARTTFLTRSAAHQERAIDTAVGFLRRLEVTAAAFPGVYQGLDSVWARRSAGLAGCYALRTSGTTALWGPALSAILAAPASTAWGTAYAACGSEFARTTFGAEMTSLAAGVDAKTASRFVYLSSYDFGAAGSFDALSQVALAGPSLQLRDHAINRLGYQAVGFGYSQVTPDQTSRWKEFFRARLMEAKSATRFTMVWRGVVGLDDDLALAIAGGKLHSLALSDTVQRNVACDAYAIAQLVRPAAWEEFQQAAQPWDTLGAPVRAVLMSNGAACGMPFARSRAATGNRETPGAASKHVAEGAAGDFSPVKPFP